MNTLIESLFGHVNTKKKIDESLSLINESIIMDQIGRENMPEFYKNLGNYGERDGLLKSTPVVSSDAKTCNRGKLTAALELARKNNDDDYKMFLKACEVRKAYLEKIVNKYSGDADNIVSTQVQILNGNARVQDAIEKTTETCNK